MIIVHSRPGPCIYLVGERLEGPGVVERVPQGALRVAAVAAVGAGDVEVRAGRAGAAALPEAPAVVLRQGQGAQARQVQRHGLDGMGLPAVSPIARGAVSAPPARPTGCH